MSLSKRQRRNLNTTGKTNFLRLGLEAPLSVRDKNKWARNELLTETKFTIDENDGISFHMDSGYEATLETSMDWPSLILAQQSRISVRIHGRLSKGQNDLFMTVFDDHLHVINRSDDNVWVKIELPLSIQNKFV